jgi:hypothetical protein
MRILPVIQKPKSFALNILGEFKLKRMIIKLAQATAQAR